jgi:hypothetical protein
MCFILLCVCFSDTFCIVCKEEKCISHRSGAGKSKNEAHTSLVSWFLLPRWCLGPQERDGEFSSGKRQKGNKD